MIQKLESSTEVDYISFSKPTFSNSEFFAMHRVLVHCAENFIDYVKNAEKPIRFSDNVVPLKKEFLKFTYLPDSFQSLFGDI